MEVKNSRNGKHRMVRCKVCARSMRSDHVKRHQRTHANLLAMDEEEIREELRARQTAAVDRDQKRREIEDIAQQEGIPMEVCTDVAEPSSSISPSTSSVLTDIETDKLLLQRKEDFTNTLLFGKRIHKSLKRGNGLEEALEKDEKHALELYELYRPRISVKKADLRPWQQQLWDLLKPSTRHVYWIVGSRGNEGKSYLQSLLLAEYGYSHAVQLDVCNKASDIYYILSRRPLRTTELFLFNDPRSQEDVSYETLEQIKDGRATSTKYAGKELHFVVPNIVIVFSNRCPARGKLSEDRWLEYHIVNGELKKKGHVRSTVTSDSKPTKF